MRDVLLSCRAWMPGQQTPRSMMVTLDGDELPSGPRITLAYPCWTPSGVRLVSVRHAGAMFALAWSHLRSLERLEGENLSSRLLSMGTLIPHLSGQPAIDSLSEVAFDLGEPQEIFALPARSNRRRAG